MTHTVCGQPVTFQERDIAPTEFAPILSHPIRLMVVHCESCGRDVTDDAELSPGRPWELVEENDGA